MKKTSKELDQFYTNPLISKYCFDELCKLYDLNNFFLFEPSAGTGAFSDLFHKNSLSIDIEPKKDYIKEQNFLNLNNNVFHNKNVFTIGNPPFGKNSSLAIKFFNKSSEFSQYIAFVIPKTFKKLSVQNKLNLEFHLELELELPLDSFIFENEKYSVPCIFQVWAKKDFKRIIIPSKRMSNLFTFTDRANADIAIRRVGGLAGKVIEDFSKYKDPSHYFIKINGDKILFINFLKSLYVDLNTISKYTAGNPSLSKDELISIVEEKIKI